MPRPRILILGKNGQVGWELCRTVSPIGDVTSVDFPGVDFASETSLLDCARGAKPDVIINAAAYTAVDKAESEPELAMKINGVAPGILAKVAADTGAWMVHYSTDYVFDGGKQSAYLEEDTPAPLSSYGRSKLAGDMAVRESGCRHLIFRLCWVYGARGQNFMRTIMRLASEREQLRVVADQSGSPTWSRMIAEATALALSQSLADGECGGTYHLAAGGGTTWHGFAQAIVDAMPLKKCSLVQPISTAEYPLPARRPARSALDCSKLERVFGVRLPDWKASLLQVVGT
jgi:dTDP-4-dehydrorhamnose reductase